MRRIWVRLAVFVPLTCFMAYDLVIDVARENSWLHITVESLVTLLGAFGLLWLAAEARGARAESKVLRGDLAVARADAERFRSENRELLSGLSRAIDAQFARWSLTEAEREVGLLLLKGLSTKEVADIRHTNERTTRQQAAALYKKAGLGGRAELSAFFLEDLMTGPYPNV